MAIAIFNPTSTPRAFQEGDHNISITFNGLSDNRNDIIQIITMIDNSTSPVFFLENGNETKEFEREKTFMNELEEHQISGTIRIIRTPIRPTPVRITMIATNQDSGNSRRVFGIIYY